MSDVLVLCYHAVSPSWDATLSVTPDSLERQLDYLAERGWRSATFREAVFDPPAPRTLAITFDDAFASVSKLAFPILDRFGFIGTVFVPTTYVSSGQRLAWAGVDHWQHTAHAAELEPMSWDDLGVLAERGWEVGSHTRTHPHLPDLDDETLRAELVESRQECTERMGRPCETVAYPYGEIDERVAAAAASAGYRAGATLSRRLDVLGPHLWPRVGIFNHDAQWRFRLKVLRPSRRLRVRLGPRLGGAPLGSVRPARETRSG